MAAIAAMEKVILTMVPMDELGCVWRKRSAGVAKLLHLDIYVLCPPPPLCGKELRFASSCA
jgi:hypothetical protein